MVIENDSFDFPWTEDEYRSLVKERNCISMVAVSGEVVLGYMVYELKKTKIHLMNFAVLKKFRRLGIGRAMIVKLYSKLNVERRQAVFANVRESNLDALLFFRANGFFASRLLKDVYTSSPDDTIVMERWYNSSP